MCKWHVSIVGLHVSMARSSTDLLTTMIILSNSIPTNACAGTPMPLSAALPKVSGLGLPFVLRHVSHDVATSASEAQPSVLWACEPGSFAGALPLPSAWVAVA